MPPPIPLDPVGLDKEMVICIDTLPDDKEITECDLEVLKKWSKLLRGKKRYKNRENECKGEGKIFRRVRKIKYSKKPTTSKEKNDKKGIKKEYEELMKDLEKENKDEIRSIRKQRKVAEEEKVLKEMEIRYQSKEKFKVKV